MKKVAIAALCLCAAAAAAEESTTVNGLTFYGTIDLGLTYQTHGTPENEYFGPSLEYLLQKNSNKSRLSLGDNALSQSNIGIKGADDLGGGFTALFNIQTQFDPASGVIADHLHAMTENNGKKLTAQSANADSSRAGQAFQNAYVGISSKEWGTLTLGRQNSLILDNILAYDPMGGAQGFSLIGFSGVTAGGGATEDTRLDSAIKYREKIVPVRFAGLYQLGVANSDTKAEQVDLGLDWEGLNLDGAYSMVRNAVAASPLSTVPLNYDVTKALAGTLSDNEAWSVYAKYKTGPVTLYGGYEHIEYSNPSVPAVAGAKIIGGYVLATVNDTAYTRHKILEVVWGGVKYEMAPGFFLTFGYDGYIQNSFSGDGCSNRSASSCSGTLDTYALVADYFLTPRFDLYAGAMYTHVFDGLANGYLNNNTVDPTIGARIRF